MTPSLPCFDRPLIGLAACAIAFATLGGCALGGGTDALTTQCVLPSDQTGTLKGKWAITPVPIAFHQGDFTDAEVSSITAAAQTWNNFFGQSVSVTAIDFGGDTPRQLTTADPPTKCPRTIIPSGTFTGAVVLYKDSSWPYASQPNAIALTSYCTTSVSSGVPALTFAVTEVNYQNFFTTSKVPDLQSILLHEFGHMLGLGHSCESGGGTGVPNCNSASLDSTYYSAVMFPVFNQDSGGAYAQKRDLQYNDEGRANCLYSTATSN